MLGKLKVAGQLLPPTSCLALREDMVGEIKGSDFLQRQQGALKRRLMEKKKTRSWVARATYDAQQVPWDKSCREKAKQQNVHIKGTMSNKLPGTEDKWSGNCP